MRKMDCGSLEWSPVGVLKISFPASVVPTLAASSLFSLHEHDSYFQVGQKIGTTGTLKFTWKENTE